MTYNSDFVNMDADCAERASQSLAFNKAEDLKMEMMEMQKTLESLLRQRSQVSEVMNKVANTYSTGANTIYNEALKQADEVLKARIPIIKHNILS